MDLCPVLDNTVDIVRMARPELSELEAAFSAIRVNLMALIDALIGVGSSGKDLSNEALFMITAGLTSSVQWMVSKELIRDLVPEIENELGK